MTSPADGHVHSEWSWDAVDGSMEASCARAVALGLPAVAFTEHLDHTVWAVDAHEVAGLPPDHPVAVLADAAGAVAPPPFDVEGYLASVRRCRELFPDLTVLGGVEVGEPHRHPEAVRRVLKAGRFDRVLGSLHSLPDGAGRFREPHGMYARYDAAEVVRRYLAEVAELVTAGDGFTVLAHIDYPVRDWPAYRGPFDPCVFEEELRHALRSAARAGLALEVNTARAPLEPVLRWWRQEGGRTVAFGSDAHDPAAVAGRFADAAALVESCGLRPARRLHEPWYR